MKDVLAIAGLSCLVYSLIKADETYLIIACISICSATVIHEIKK